MIKYCKYLENEVPKNDEDREVSSQKSSGDLLFAIHTLFLGISMNSILLNKNWNIMNFQFYDR